MHLPGAMNSVVNHNEVPVFIAFIVEVFLLVCVLNIINKKFEDVTQEETRPVRPEHRAFHNGS